MNEQQVLQDNALALEARNAKLRSSNHRLHHFLNSIQALVAALDVPSEDDQVMDLLSGSLDALISAIDATFGNLLVHDEDSGQLVYILVNGQDAKTQMRWQHIDADSGVMGWVLRHGEAVIVNDAPADERFNAVTDIPSGADAESLMVIPVISSEQRMGIITLINKGGDGMFTDDDQTLVWLMSRFAGELLQRMSR